MLLFYVSPALFQPVSVFPQCANDLSFWLPKEGEFSHNDFYDIVREVGEDLIEQVGVRLDRKFS